MRRLRQQQARLNGAGAGGLYPAHYQTYGINQTNPLSQTFNCLNSDLQRVTVTPKDSLKDPLAIAERGKVGVPSSHSECSSNDSIEVSLDSQTNTLNAAKRGKIKDFWIPPSEVVLK